MANIIPSKKEARRVYNDTHTKSDTSFAKAYHKQKQFAREHGATGSAVRAFARASVNNAPAAPMQPVALPTQGLAVSAAPITPARVLAEQTAAQATPAIGRVETSPGSIVAVPTFKPLARIDEEHDAKMREKQAWAAKNPISAMQEDLIAKGYTLRGKNNGIDGIFGNSTYLALGEALKDKEWADTHPEYANMYAQHKYDLGPRKPAANTTTATTKPTVVKKANTSNGGTLDGATVVATNPQADLSNTQRAESNAVRSAVHTNPSADELAAIREQQRQDAIKNAHQYGDNFSLQGAVANARMFFHNYDSFTHKGHTYVWDPERKAYYNMNIKRYYDPKGNNWYVPSNKQGGSLRRINIDK